MIDWAGMFSFGVSPLELFIRGSLMWWFIFLVFRFLMRRDMGEVGAADILLLVLVADAAQNGMADEYKTVSEGIVLVATLFFWNWAIDALAMHFAWAEKLISPAPILLIRNGRYMHRSIKKLHLDIAEIQSVIRKNNLSNVHDVKTAWFESDGTISVIPKRTR